MNSSWILRFEFLTGAGLEVISGSERVGDRPGGDRGEGTAGGDEARVVEGVDQPGGKEEGEPAAILCWICSRND